MANTIESSKTTRPKKLPQISDYTLTEQLYQGTKTDVYRGIGTDQQPVVIKVLSQAYPSFSDLTHFRNQYAITKTLSIPGIARPINLEPWKNGYALIMEDFGGTALNLYASSQSTDTHKSSLPVIDVLGIALQITDTLHALSQEQVVHKDIKPANILIHPESKRVQLIDFSIASRLPKETQTMQAPAVLEGTLAYLAPEQTGRMNRGIDYRTDFYSLGITLYELLTGTVPFSSSDLLEVIHAHMAKVPTPPCVLDSTIPPMVSQIVLKLMAKNAEDRYQSALGLKHDLETCLHQIKENGNVSAFDLGRYDVSDRFLIPEKLYGREAEVQRLLAAFDRASQGQTEMMLVAGFSGIGKTAVVNEIHKPITRQRGYFIQGEFDQLNRNIPFSAFVEAFRHLMGQLLSESDTALAAWKRKILEAVGGEGQVIINVIPEVKCIIGEQPDVQALSGAASQSRFNSIFSKFVRVFTSLEHPLVIFLDDLQWADSASLSLLELLMQTSKEQAGYLLLLGAYRDNEVSASHPFIHTLDKISAKGATLNTITLAPLAQAEVTHLIADTFLCSAKAAAPLSTLVCQKTQGNPFFVTQFLKGLHEENCISFNQEDVCWQCDLVKVKQLATTDDVVAFMIQRLQKLPEGTQAALKLAACIGNSFDLTLLTAMCDLSQDEVVVDLWQALKEGLILPENSTYKFFQGERHLSNQDQISKNITVEYRFLHDRVQQAAYALLPEEFKPATHYRLGRYLLQARSQSEKDDTIFSIVNHLNFAQQMLTENAEREELAQLNLEAAKKALSSVAYQS
ncbi:MAG: serine/threonine-protein kinase PknK, partial [Cyanobacteria bacterium J06632_3]